VGLCLSFESPECGCDVRGIRSRAVSDSGAEDDDFAELPVAAASRYG
jgi:hypothetical protein